MSDTASLVVRVKSEGVASTKRDITSLTSAAKVGAGAVAAIGAAAIAAGTAITAMAVRVSKSDRELSNLSRTAKTTREDFAALSFVFKQYNVDAKGTADAMNDVSERLGEFAAAGSGPFQDFADVMGMTKQEAVAMATELQRLKPEEAIQRMVKQMEDAGVQGAQMSFVMKSMSNDLEYAADAFANNGKEIQALKKEFRDLNGELIINQKQSEQLAGVAKDYELLTSALGGASSVISSSLAPTMSDFFNSVIEVVPNATNTIVDFINTFNKAEDIQSIAQIDRQMKDLADTIENGVAKGYDKMSRNMQENPLDFVRVGKYQDAVARLAELESQRTKLLDEQKTRELELAKIRSGGAITGGDDRPKMAAGTTADQFAAQQKQAEAYLEQLRQANLNEMQLIDAQQAEKQSKLLEYKNSELISEQQYQDALTEIQTNAVIQRAELQNKYLDMESKNRDESRKAELAATSAQAAQKERQVDNAISAQRNMTQDLKTALGEQSSIYKASAITTALVNTYQSATGAYAAMASIPYVGPVLGAAAAGAAIVAGMANVAAIRGAREQGGSMFGGSAYQMAERGKAEVIVPAGASRARTAAQMRDIMGQNQTTQAPNITILNQTSGKVDNTSMEQQSDGSWLLRIEEFMSDRALDPDSMFSKSLRA